MLSFLWQTKSVPMKNNKKQPPRGFFDEQEALEKLSKLKDPLEKLNSHINSEVFRETLETIYTSQNPKSNAGAKPYDGLPAGRQVC